MKSAGGIHVLKPGVYTTLQDEQGRIGYRSNGVPVSGAMDRWSAALANRLVGNSSEAALLEITWVGPTLHFQRNAWISICGGDLSVHLDGQQVPMWRPVYIPSGSMLRIGSFRKGCRAYLAVHGGFQTKPVLGSSSTYVRAKLGGKEGRPLLADDHLELRDDAGDMFLCEQMAEKGNFDQLYYPKWHAPKLDWPDQPVIRMMKGREAEWFGLESFEKFLGGIYTIQSASDRMGYRLSGEVIQRDSTFQMTSEPVVMGTIQVPPDGNPIILMADGQTTGGYPRIAQVAAVDLPVLAQQPPGTKLRFQLIDWEEAMELLHEKRKYWNAIVQGLKLKEGDK